MTTTKKIHLRQAKQSLENAQRSVRRARSLEHNLVLLNALSEAEDCIGMSIGTVDFAIGTLGLVDLQELQK